MAASTSADLNPIEFSEDWHNFYVSGVKSPGVIVVNGINGFDRETEWDKKKGKGANGATLSLVQRPLAEGSIKSVLWLPEHFAEWQAFRPLLKYTQSKDKNPKDAFDIWHPSLADLAISTCVTRKISPAYHIGSGRYEITIEFIEWRPVPAKPIVVTPAGATANGSTQKPPGDPGDPVGDRQQQIIADLMNQGAQTPVG